MFERIREGLQRFARGPAPDYGLRREKAGMILVHERLRDQLKKNMEEAAQNLRQQGLPVDLDELGWDAARHVEGFVSQDPNELVRTAKSALHKGLISQEEHDDMLRDAELIRGATG